MICSYLLTLMKRLHKIKDGPDVRRISSQRDVAEFLVSPIAQKIIDSSCPNFLL